MSISAKAKFHLINADEWERGIGRSVPLPQKRRLTYFRHGYVSLDLKPNWKPQHG